VTQGGKDGGGGLSSVQRQAVCWILVAVRAIEEVWEGGRGGTRDDGSGGIQEQGQHCKQASIVIGRRGGRRGDGGGNVGRYVRLAMRGNNNAGSTNANNNNNAPPPPPENDGNAPWGEGNGTTTVPDDNVTAAAASRDAVTTKVTSAVGHWGAGNLHTAADGMGGFMIMCLVLFDCRVWSGHDGGLDGGGGTGRRRTIVQQ
jgi:hypothetical protein